MKIAGIKSVQLKDAAMAESGINQHMQTVTAALNNALTFDDNMIAQTNEIVFSSQDFATFPVSFNWLYPQKQPLGCIITYIDVTPEEEVEYILSPVSPRWTYVDGKIVIRAIRGVFTPYKFYLARFLTYGG